MSKKIISYRNGALFVLLMEVVIVLIIAGISADEFWTKLFIISAIQNVICSIFLFYYTHLFETDQVEIEDALGEDFANASIFGRIGILKYDENRNIMWTSELFQQYDFDLIGVKLLEWLPALEKTFDEEDICSVNIKGYNFDVYNNTASHMIYFRDMSDYHDLKDRYYDDQTVFGYLTLDNYDECIQNIDEQKVARIQSTMRNDVSVWASEYGIVIRRFRSDGYIFVCNERIYQKLADDRFSILNKIREDAKSLGIIITLSIGIARNFDSLKETDEAANSALNLAYFRGGDQVVVKTNNEKIRFFGGNSETNSGNNRVRARVTAKSLNGLISSASNVLIMGHKQSDLDSLGGSIGAHRIVANLNIPSYIIVNYDSMEDKTYRVSQILKKDEAYTNVLVSPSKAMELIDGKTLLILVDNHKESLAIDAQVIHSVKNIVVIDHHRRSEEFVNGPILTYLEPSSSSCVELVTELFDYQDKAIHLSELEATIMYAGMLIDTNYYRARVGVRTLQCAAKLKEYGANMALAYEYLEDDFDDVKLRIDIMQKAYRYRPNIVIAYYDGEAPIQTVTLAKAGNQLLDTAGIDAVFTLGLIKDNRIAISARSSRNINVQIIMENLGGGGHFGMAACQLPDYTIQQAIDELEKEIDRYIEEREE